MRAHVLALVWPDGDRDGGAISDLYELRTRGMSGVGSRTAMMIIYCGVSWLGLEDHVWVMDV